jgi:hypothetical protein
MDTIIKEGQNGQLVGNGDAKLLAKAIDKVTCIDTGTISRCDPADSAGVWLAEYRLCHHQGIRRDFILGKSEVK